MARFLKAVTFDLAVYALGYMTYSAAKVLGRTTLLRGRALFGR
jgi:hypothetical protein